MGSKGSMRVLPLALMAGGLLVLTAAVPLTLAACGPRTPEADTASTSADPAATTTPDGGPDAMELDNGSSTGGSIGRGSDLGPAALAFDRYGLVPEDRFDEVLVAVAAAERAFAADAIRDGMKQSFLRWMLPTATVFAPGPRPAGEVYGGVDESTQPRLAWAPQRVEASAAGDLAVSTGPYRLEPHDGGEPRFGNFFSVWQRQSDGSWRVVCDLGASTLDEPTWPTTAWGHRVRLEAPRTMEIPVALPLITSLEERLARDAGTMGFDAALARVAADDIHLLREGVPARLGREFLRSEADLGLGDDEVSFSTDLAGAAVANSNDLAAGWGVTTSSEGHRDVFARVWRREKTQWLVAFDVRVPLVGSAGDE